MKNIAICGKMASGKTTLAHTLRDEANFEVMSLAGAVKRLGSDLFGMVEKDRPLLQQIGMKMREIRPTVWIDYLVSQADSVNESQYCVAVDDVRFVNEAKRFKDEGWILVKMDIGEELQIETGKKDLLILKYKDDFLGCGKASEKKITNFIPKNRRLKSKTII